MVRHYPDAIDLVYATVWVKTFENFQGNSFRCGRYFDSVKLVPYNHLGRMHEAKLAITSAGVVSGESRE